MTPSSRRTVRFGNRRMHRTLTWFVMYLMAMLFIGVALFCRVSPPVNLAPADRADDDLTVLRMALQAAHTPRQHLELLKAFRLWDLSRLTEIPGVLFDRYPSNLYLLPDVETRKRIFLHTLLPVALTAINEVEQERARLDTIIARSNVCSASDDLASDSVLPWPPSCVDRDDAEFIRFLHDKYRTTSIQQLLRRVNVVPVSLILAQGAVESSWGGSRFARLGNNLFGLWTWGDDGMVPLNRDEGKTHKLMQYDSILDSVRDYLLTVNRVDAYGTFRTIRQQTLDPLALTEGLMLYSERGQDYVDDLKTVIRYNKLQGFDRFRLTNRFPLTPATTDQVQ